MSRLAVRHGRSGRERPGADCPQDLSIAVLEQRADVHGVVVRSVSALAVTLVALLPCNPAASESQDWQVSKADVRVVCPITVGGSFEARTSSLTGSIAFGAGGSSSSTPPSASFAVDLRTLDTGIDLRNEHLRRNYLEVDKGHGFDTATLSEIQLGDINLETFEGKTSFTAALLLHGTKKSIKGQAEIRRSPSAILVDATFPVTLADYGIPKPQYLGVGVKSQVQVKVSLAAAR
jgi:hypothetical protein